VRLLGKSADGDILSQRDQDGRRNGSGRTCLQIESSWYVS
jgi:hypothetical protein